MKEKMPKTENPLVYMNISVDGDPPEMMIFELFLDTTPKTAENFRALCTGEKGPRSKEGLHYKGTLFHFIKKGLLAQGGSLLEWEGFAGENIYGDEPPKLKHDQRGLLSMSVAERAARGTVFTLMFEPQPNPYFDSKYVVFGKLVHGHEVLDRIENADGGEGIPAVKVKVVDSGQCLERDSDSDTDLDPSESESDTELGNSESDTDLDTSKSTTDSDLGTSDSETSLPGVESQKATPIDISSSSDEPDPHSDSTSSFTDISSDDSPRDKYKSGKKKDKRCSKRQKTHNK